MRTRAHNFYLLVGLLSIVCTIARADNPSGIKFFTGSWKDLLAEAKRQNKPVFVDVYTTWCGPCKQMAKEAFPDAKVGEKFNAHFVNYQIDAEKGEGRDIARKYAVEAYPTSLYVSASGDLIQRTIGYGGIKGMLDQADQALIAAKDPNPLSAMEKQYEVGKRDPEFLAAYLQKRASVGMPNGEALEAYLKTVPRSEWKSEKNINLLASNLSTINSLAFNFLLDYVSTTSENAYKGQLLQALYRATTSDLTKAITNKNESDLEKVVIAQQQVSKSENAKYATLVELETIANYNRMQFYRETKNTAKYCPLAVVEANKLMKLSRDSLKTKSALSYRRFEEETKMMTDSAKQTDQFKKNATMMKTIDFWRTAAQLNQFAWNYYEMTSDKKDLNLALTWSAKSLEYDRSSTNLDTYAHLLSKLGRKAEAIKTQQEAIANEKAAGRETAAYEKELAIMKQK